LTANQKFTVTAIFLGLFLVVGADPCSGQSAPPVQDAYLLEPSGLSPAIASEPESVVQPSATEPAVSSLAVSGPAESGSAAPMPAQVGAPPEDTGWHFAVSPYLWFPGVHGTLGARNQSASIHASPGDLLSHFRFGLMGAVEPRYKRFVMPFDMMWIRLEDDKGIPNLGDTVDRSVTVKATEFLLTQKVGYRVIDSEKIKIDALAGFRYWHLGESLTFNPSGINFSPSQNWVDPLVGARIQFALSPKIAVNVLGDVGGWGAGSQLDYQFAALLGYKIKPKLALQAGFRYLYVDYTNGARFATVVTSGVIFGLTYNLK
jgi:hypothetical protein